MTVKKLNKLEKQLENGFTGLEFNYREIKANGIIVEGGNNFETFSIT